MSLANSRLVSLKDRLEAEEVKKEVVSKKPKKVIKSKVKEDEE